MRRISSRMTFYYKRVFPAFWFGFLILLILFSLAPLIIGGQQAMPPAGLFIVPVIMLVFGFFFMKKLVFDLVDEVWDDGDTLLVKNRGEEDRILLRNISNVSYSSFMNPPRVTLSLRSPGVFGKRITFAAPVRFIPFTTSPLIDELIERVDAARQQRK